MRLRPVGFGQGMFVYDENTVPADYERVLEASPRVDREAVVKVVVDGRQSVSGPVVSVRRSVLARTRPLAEK